MLDDATLKSDLVKVDQDTAHYADYACSDLSTIDSTVADMLWPFLLTSSSQISPPACREDSRFGRNRVTHCSRYLATK